MVWNGQKMRHDPVVEVHLHATDYYTIINRNTQNHMKVEIAEHLKRPSTSI